MSAQHTPALEAIGNLVRSTMAPTDGRPRGILIAEVFDGFGQPHSDEAKATAVLFAAGPDLLSACYAQHRAIDMLMARLMVLDPAFLPTKSPVWPLLVQGNDAIAKATGSAA